MKILGEKGGIRYTLLGEEDCDEVAHVVGAVFTDGSEPITRKLGTDSDKFARFVGSLCPKFIQEGLSVVARSVATGRIVGAQLNDDMGTSIPDLTGQHDWIAPAMTLLEELDHRYFGDRHPEPNECVHLFFIAVLLEHRQQQVSSQLLELSLEIAANKGYELAVAEATGLISQHVLSKAGFKSRAEVPYAAFECHGSRPFEGISDHPSAMLMERKIGSKAGGCFME